jgi:hypothetical protein
VLAAQLFGASLPSSVITIEVTFRSTQFVPPPTEMFV